MDTFDWLAERLRRSAQEFVCATGSSVQATAPRTLFEAAALFAAALLPMLAAAWVSYRFLSSSRRRARLDGLWRLRADRMPTLLGSLLEGIGETLAHPDTGGHALRSDLYVDVPVVRTTRADAEAAERRCAARLRRMGLRVWQG